jgi:hypothetical protein
MLANNKEITANISLYTINKHIQYVVVVVVV